MAFRPSTYSDIHEVYAMDNGGCSKKEAALKAAKSFAAKQKILTKARKAADKKVAAAAKALRDCKKAKKSGAKKTKAKKTSKVAGTWTLPSSSTGASAGTARSTSLADIRAGKVAKSTRGPSEGTSTDDSNSGGSIFTASASDSGFTASVASDGSSTDSGTDSADGADSVESEDSESGWMTPALIVGGLAIIGVGAFMYHKSKKNGTSIASTVSSSAADAKKAVASAFTRKATPTHGLEATPTIHVPDEEPAY